MEHGIIDISWQVLQSKFSAQQPSDILGNLFALNPRPIFVEVHRILIRIQVLHHECMLVVHWNPSRTYKRKRNAVPCVHTIVRGAMWRINFHGSSRRPDQGGAWRQSANRGKERRE